MAEKEPDVSVVIPTYNRLWCLPRAIESVRDTRCVTEIVVVDDGSSDGTFEWLRKQNDIVVVRQANQGQTWAINNGVLKSTGRYIRFLDSDDFLERDTIDRQFECAEESQADITYSRVDFFQQSSGTITRTPDLAAWDDFMAVQLGEPGGGHFLGMLFRRELVLAVPRRPDFAFREDRMFLLEVALMNPTLCHVDKCAGYWVQHEQQMQGNYSGMLQVVTNWQHLKIYRCILGRLAMDGHLTERRKRAASQVLWRLAHWIAYTHPEEASEVADWIRQLVPDFDPPEPGLLGWMYRWLNFRRTEEALLLRRRVNRMFR